MIALYVRVSTQEQAQHGYSVGEQSERLQKYADAIGWKNTRLYTDPGYSGSNIDRPALQSMIRDILRGRVEKVVVYKLDRLSRSQKDTLELIEDVFLKNGVDFISMSENFDTSTPFGRASIGVLAVFAQLEREQIKERMQMGREARAKSGKYKGNCRPPIGYSYSDDELHVIEFEAFQIREAFAQAERGITPGKIAEDLNARGLNHRFGKWTSRTVRNVLRSQIYIGKVSYHDDWYDGIHEPLISLQQFAAVQAFLNYRTENYSDKGKRSGRVSSYLGGMLYCAQCGGKYTHHKSTQYGKHGQVYISKVYSCNSRQKKPGLKVWAPECRNKIWKAAELEKLIFDEIRKLSADPSLIKPQESHSDDTRKALQKELKKIDAEISRALDLYVVDGIPLDALQKRIEEMQQRRHLLEQQLEQDLRKRTPRTTARAAKKAVASFADIIEKGDLHEVHLLVTALIDKIVLDGENIDIYWSFS